MHLSSLFRPKVWTLYMLLRKPGRLLSDKTFLKFKYWALTGKKLNLENPMSFNEKLQWLKLNDRRTIFTTMADKHAVREYVKNIIGEEYLIPLLGIWVRPEDIDFDTLPKQFVLKCNHDCGSVIICHDKSNFDKASAVKKLNKCLKSNYYWQGREWPYKNIKPKIVAEKYMGDELMDCKFMSFDGNIRCLFTVTDRFTGNGIKVTFFDTKWHRLPFERKYPAVSHDIHQPSNLEEMIKIAQVLSDGIPFVRVDLYEINGKIYFGEMTFFPGGGMETFYPEEWDFKLGSWIQLPERKT